ncbi:allophanate hydrolase [Lelliottia sp. CFBP8978]|uniref:allophanate hydrolase n=1 Tax=Lelliottia sp. CFBP8978 TaxID=3096522 RepID=UPI002A6AAAB5|nr:allophanate hydrolase [Lelliottia sp. CFBP8978]MDY1038354.1 allophanate hydrolase [Lelliottia sp. CFBP8978]
MKHPYDLRIDVLTQAYRDGQLTPREVIATLRERALALNPEFNAFIHILTPEEQEPYLAALENVQPTSLPLYGVPFAIKDNIDLAGIDTTAACPAFACRAEQDATIVAQLIALGAVPMGKTNLDQFATGLNGTRSPYGPCRNSVHADYPSGGSSSGSSLAVALGLASFALGTDTAGSGRVPASLNNLIGLKATKGLISTAGVVPACRTLDCVTFFTTTAAEASRLLALTAVKDPRDEYSRSNPLWNGPQAFGVPAAGFCFGVPDRLEFLGCAESEMLYHTAKARLIALGGVPLTIDFSPFLAAAKLLYDGPWVAERYHVAGALIEQQPEAVLPVIRDVLQHASSATAVVAFEAQYSLQRFKTECDAILDKLACVLTPTYPRPVSLAELADEPVKSNAELGVYTNFMNLLDYAAVAVPAGFMVNGLPSGVTLFGRAFTDQYLLSLADALQRQSAIPLPGERTMQEDAPTGTATNDRLQLIVCGAHLDGLALSFQLRQRGATRIQSTFSAPHYRLYALADGKRPGLVRDAEQGAAIAVEVWEMPHAEVGSFLAGISAPLGLGKVELQDGRWLTGFICEGVGLQGAREITEYGGWRAWLAQQQ